MKITLDNNQTFWALIDPMTNKILLTLTENKTSDKLELETLPAWAKKQILLSVKGKRIKVDVELSLLETKAEVQTKEPAVATVAPAVKKASAVKKKAVSVKKQTSIK